MRLGQLLSNKKVYLSVLIIVLANLLLLPTLKGLLSKIHLINPLWLVELIGMFLITLIFFIITLEVFEI